MNKQRGENSAKFRNKDPEVKKLKLQTLQEQSPKKIPIIFEQNQNCKTKFNTRKKKFMVPRKMNMMKFFEQLRKKWNLSPEKAIFFSCKQKIIKPTQTAEEIYNQYRDEDGFLYIQYDFLKSFGQTPA